MRITPSIDSGLVNTTTNNMVSAQVNEQNKASRLTSNSTEEVSVSISRQANLSNDIDVLFDKADSIFQSHITPAQQKALNESYAKLDELFSKNSPSDLEQKSADVLFDRIDKIFNMAEKQLTPSEKEQLAAIDTKLDELLGAEELKLEQGFSEEIDSLFQQSEGLLTSKLSTKQKKSLDDLNQQLNALFEKNNVADEAVNGIFDKIDSILEQGYDKLSVNDKEDLADIDKNIEQLFEQLNQF